MSGRYRKRPVVIEAWQVELDRRTRFPDWLSEAVLKGQAFMQGGESPYLTIRTLEGDMRANPGDWIIRGVKGELYPRKPDIFAATYEATE